MRDRSDITSTPGRILIDDDAVIIAVLPDLREMTETSPFSHCPIAFVLTENRALWVFLTSDTPNPILVPLKRYELTLLEARSRRVAR